MSDQQAGDVGADVRAGHEADDVEGHSLMEEFARDSARERAREADRWSRQEQLSRGSKDHSSVRRRVGRLLRGR